MDINLYLLSGLLLSLLFCSCPKRLVLVLTTLYWLIWLLWSVGLSHLLTVNPLSWVSFLDLTITYGIDGLSQLFTFLISGIGIIVFIYAWCYTQDTIQHRNKLLSLLQLFAISMLGLVLSDNLLMLFLCWELTSVISYLLIQFDVTDKEANQVAFNSLFVSVSGSLALLVGFIVLNNMTQQWSISGIIEQLVSSPDLFSLSLAFYLILCGVVTKSAQFPFYFWLTGAMKAPTPVSAYLHSATMVNAGIYLLARFHPLFSELAMWYPLLSFFGSITMALSSLLGVLQHNLKKLLAYTTIFALGAMVYLLGGVDVLPIEAFAIFLLFHGVYKAAAFMLAGVLSKACQSLNLSDLAGVSRHRPLLAVVLVIIFGSMAGLPPFFGFTIKEMIYEAKLAAPSVSYVLMSVSVVSSMLIAVASFRCLWYFFKKNHQVPPLKPSLSFAFWCPAFLALMILSFSVFERYIDRFVQPAVESVLSASHFIGLQNPVTSSVLLSFVTVCGGVILFVIFSLCLKSHKVSLGRFTLRGLFEYGFQSLLRFGNCLTRMTQGQVFVNQLRIFLSAVIVLFLLVAVLERFPVYPFFNGHLSIRNLIACAFLVISSLSLLVSRRFLYNLISLSLVGFASAFFFIVNGAIDVAITQLLVEVLTIIILLMALRHVEVTQYVITPASRGYNALIAMSMGCIVIYLLSLLQQVDFSKALSSFYAQHSLPLAHGKNIVNVILVDFRSLDTLGEAIVIVATAIGVVLLLNGQMQRDNKRKS